MADNGAHKGSKPGTGEREMLVTSRPVAGVAEVTLNRPATRNSLSLAMLERLEGEISALASDGGFKAIVLAATGPVFSAGHDLKEITGHRSDPDGGRAFFEQIMAQCSRTMVAVVRSPKPVIAAVEGTATAAGCQLVASADLAVASSNAKFCTPGVNIGLFCSTPMVALSRNLPRKRAMEMLLLGEMIDAETACELGLVNRVVEAGAAREAALEIASRIAAKSSRTVRTGKAAFYAQAEMSLDEAYAYTSRVMVENLLDADAEEGICAFIEKRVPSWRED
ncbi:MAG: Enoyl CoA hydratase [Pseudomonadota bacterium]|jgi:enoyl-CoA hydratase/carnithine racemase